MNLWQYNCERAAADGADWKYYKEKCKVLLIFSQEKWVFPYDYITDDSALAPNSHPSCFPACWLCEEPVLSPEQGPRAASPGTTRPTRGAGGLCAQLCVALQEPLHPPTALQHRHLLLIDSDSRHHKEC